MSDGEEKWVYATTRKTVILDEFWSVRVPEGMTEQEVMRNIKEDAYALWDYEPWLDYAEEGDTITFQLLRINK